MEVLLTKTAENATGWDLNRASWFFIKVKKVLELNLKDEVTEGEEVANEA